MKYVLTLLISLLVAACGAPRSQSETKIIDGLPLKKTDPILKSMVALIDRSGQTLCSGVVLGPQTFLTAGHCVLTGSATGSSVRSGDDVTFSNSQVVRVKDWKIHESFSAAGLAVLNPTTPTADLAIVQTETAIPGVFPAQFVAKDFVINVGQELRIGGYGRSDGDDSSSSGIALYWDFLVATLNSSAHEMILTDTDLHMACHGDSGGPVFVMINNKPLVAGLVSRGRKTCDTNATAVTDIRPYLEWLKQKSK